jgi:hypothetical protein
MHTTFVHLSGSKRGRSETFDRDLIQIGTAPGCMLRFSDVKDPGVSPHHAQIRFENCEFLLTDLGSTAGTFVNGRQVTEVILQNGDIIEVGQGGPKLRFRVRPEELATCTPFRVILSDSHALARASPAGRVSGATAFVTYLVRAVVREASWKVKGAGVGLALLLVALLVGVPVALYSGQRSAERALTALAAGLQTEQVLRGELERRVAESRQHIEGYRGELTDFVATLRVERERQAAQLDRTERKLRALEAEGGAGERIIRAFAGGVALLQGAVAFDDSAGRPLRYLGMDEKGQESKMTIPKGIFMVAGAAVLVAAGVFAWSSFNRAQIIVSHSRLTRLEVGLLNDTCEMCHWPESEFYRGQVKVSLARPDWKGPVTCTDCHDFVHKEPVAQKCVECHTTSYLLFLTEWTTGFDEEIALIAKRLQRAESALARAPREDVLVPRAKKLAKEAREALDLIKRGRGVHHPDAAHALLAVARQKAENALAIEARR